jgi:hypothetical protein
MAIIANGSANAFRVFGSMRIVLDVSRSTVSVMPVEVIFNAVMVLYVLMSKITIILNANVHSIIDITPLLTNANTSTTMAVLMANNGINTTINANQPIIAIEAELKPMENIMQSPKIVN